IAARRAGTEIDLDFEDAGVGIPGDMLERIFEPFTQVQRPRDAALGGLGLGLALVKKLVELHGGTVRAESGGSDRGSEFVVLLPAAVPATGVDPDPVPAPALTTGDLRPSDAATSLRVLVVDDVVDAAESLAGVLRLQG